MGMSPCGLKSAGFNNLVHDNRIGSIEMNNDEFQEILSQVESLDQELGHGAYGKIKYCGKVCAAKVSTNLLFV